ncbi:trans-resveratrol di-O-methyltransferase [Ricinus communis]|uniref:O-methyltransferase, putative n=1 Tax=Ricinus communis TaxID=3988 RepID=B9S9B7_RICCO|nr:trans-resveratrol di-O-methyltransferase [Ricinus communis]EEF39886.1 o-methyltransferase, putative [Ricinus communis]|eukprot:XP_002522586.1 trans-resveratrol di-O-methyltransferase [Ricinus communis]
MDSVQSPKATDLLQAQTHIYNHIFNNLNSMCLKCSVQLGIPDIIQNHGKPITLPELVSALNIHPGKTTCLYRLMRMLVYSGFFVTTETPDGQEAYDLTPSTRLLVKDNPNCLSSFVIALLWPDYVAAGHYLGDWFKNNKLDTVYDQAHGMEFWEYNERHPEYNQIFNESMASDSRMMNLVIGDCKPIFEGLNSVVDVGGGNGSLARIISQNFPHMQCTVLDRAQVVGSLEGSKNLNYVPGDMFKHVPSADAAILKLVLHCWNDEECIRILKNCREAIASKGKGGKVIVIDIVVDEKKEQDELTETKLLFDILMMVVVNGTERTEKEWKRLFLEAGFSHYKITPLLGVRSLIEVYP